MTSLQHLLPFKDSSGVAPVALEGSVAAAIAEGFCLAQCFFLFPVPVQGTSQTKWVLMVGFNPGAPQGGGMDEYFVGNFDGTTFTADDTVGRLMDFGKDFYAAQIYNNDLQAQLEAENNSVTVQNLTAYSLKSIWR